MGKAKASSPSEPVRKSRRPALNPESRENQMIALAIDLAEQQLLDGTASSQVITHYLKLGTTRERLEKEKVENENKLLLAKVKALESQEHSDSKYEEVLRALRTYNGQAVDYDDSDVY